MTVSTVTRRASSVLPSDPYERSAFLTTLIGSYITLSSGDFEISGVLITVIQPALHAERPAPVVIIDTGLERIAGPILAGDAIV
jgi:hypothetical protein